MDIPLPLGALLKKPLEKLDRFLFQETFETSHNEYLKRETFLKKWKFLAHNIEISYQLPSILDNAKIPSVRFAIRVSSDIIIDKLILRIEARSGVRYQENLTLYNVSNIPIINTLSSIPLRDIYFDKEIGIYQSVREIKVYIQELIINGSSIAIDSNQHVYHSHPTDFDLLNMRFTHRWGRYWNLYEIDYEINYLQNKAKYYLITPKILRSRSSDITTKEKLGHICRSFIGRPVYLCFCNKYMCRLWFWFKIIVLRQKFKVRK